MSFNVGDRFGDYEILNILGAGGMGQVYKVRNVISDRVEAAKVLLPDLEGDPELAERFLREIRLLASLDHPNIARLQTALRAEGQLLMIMEYVEGTTIEEMLHQGKIPLEDGLGYIRQVLTALDYAHSRNIIHRDIKPANMMVTPAGTVKLMDFGIAKAVADHGLTQTGNTMGSIYYMSPEQIQGVSELDQRCDIYSLGVAMYEIVTGRRPFIADSAYSLMAAHLKETPPPPVELDSSVPSALNEIILMAIAKDPAKRFQTAGALLGALNSVAPAAASAPPPVTKPAPTAAPAGQPAPMKTTASPPPPEAPPVQPKSRRLLYITLGSLATIVVLVLAAIQVPKWFGAEAGGSGTEAPVSVESSPPPPADSSPAEQAVGTQETTAEAASSQEQSAEAGATGNQPAQQAPQGSKLVSESPPAAVHPKTPTATSRVVKPAPVAVAPRPKPETAAKSSAGTPHPPARIIGDFTPPPAGAMHAPAPRIDAAREKSLRESREQLMLMAVRVSSVKQSLETMRQEQARMGVGLRGDIASSSQRLEFYLDEAESALNHSEAEAAKTALGKAERELGKLERFLGH